MSSDRLDRDDTWNRNARHENQVQRLDRNWGDLLQELRVVQTGVQLLTGFLLTLPFQARFAELPVRDTRLYLATVACSAAATVALITPVAMHRVLFRRHKMHELVGIAHWFAIAGIALLGLALLGLALPGLALIGVLTLVFDTVLHEP